MATSQPVGGFWHAQKAEQFVVALERWLANHPFATSQDRHVAEQVIDDLKDAIKK
jgi:filamentous hemagglutinin